MSVIQIGSAQTVDFGLGASPSPVNITVPAGCTLVIVNCMQTQAQAGGSNPFLGATLGGVAPLSLLARSSTPQNGRMRNAAFCFEPSSAGTLALSIGAPLVANLRRVVVSFWGSDAPGIAALHAHTVAIGSGSNPGDVVGVVSLTAPGQLVVFCDALEDVGGVSAVPGVASGFSSIFSVVDADDINVRLSTIVASTTTTACTSQDPSYSSAGAVAITEIPVSIRGNYFVSPEWYAFDNGDDHIPVPAEAVEGDTLVCIIHNHSAPPAESLVGNYATLQMDVRVAEHYTWIGWKLAAADPNDDEAVLVSEEMGVILCVKGASGPPSRLAADGAWASDPTSPVIMAGSPASGAIGAGLSEPSLMFMALASEDDVGSIEPGPFYGSTQTTRISGCDSDSQMWALLMERASSPGEDAPVLRPYIPGGSMTPGDRYLIFAVPFAGSADPFALSAGEVDVSSPSMRFDVNIGYQPSAPALQMSAPPMAWSISTEYQMSAPLIVMAAPAMEYSLTGAFDLSAPSFELAAVAMEWSVADIAVLSAAPFEVSAPAMGWEITGDKQYDMSAPAFILSAPGMRYDISGGGGGGGLSSAGRLARRRRGPM